jgi:hypothetical protein
MQDAPYMFRPGLQERFDRTKIQSCGPAHDDAFLCSPQSQFILEALRGLGKIAGVVVTKGGKVDGRIRWTRIGELQSAVQRGLEGAAAIRLLDSPAPNPGSGDPGSRWSDVRGRWLVGIAGGIMSIVAMTLRLTEHETDALRRRADLEGRSMQEVTRQAIREYIESHSRADLLDRVLAEELPRYAEALERLAQ